MIDKKKCIGCGSCVSICPVLAITLDDDGKAEIDENVCIKCGACENMCPVVAIKIN